MKKLSLIIVMLVCATILIAASVSNYTEQGGARTVIGGSLDVASGGDLDIESGGALKLAGTEVTASAAELNILDGSSGGNVMLAQNSTEIYSIIVDVSATEIKDLAANPKELIATPGANKILKLLSCMLVLDKGSTAYDDATGDGNMYICYDSGDGLKATGSIEGDAFIDATADFLIAVEPAALAATATAGVSNKALVLDNDAAEYTTGDGVLEVFLTYAIVPDGL